MLSYIDVLENNKPRTAYSGLRVNMLKFIPNGSPRLREFDFKADTSLFSSSPVPISHGFDLSFIYPLTVGNNASIQIKMTEFSGGNEDKVLMVGYREGLADLTDVWTYFLPFKFTLKRTKQSRMFFEVFQNIPNGFIFLPAYLWGVQEDYSEREGSIINQMYKGSVNIYQKKENKAIGRNLLPVESLFPTDKFFLFPKAETITDLIRIQFNAEFDPLPDDVSFDWTCYLNIGGLICSYDKVESALKVLQSWRFHNAS